MAAHTEPHLRLWTCLAVSTTVRYGPVSVSAVLPVLTPAVLLAGPASGLLPPLWLRLLTDRAPEREEVAGRQLAGPRSTLDRRTRSSNAVSSAR